MRQHAQCVLAVALTVARGVLALPRTSSRVSGEPLAAKPDNPTSACNGERLRWFNAPDRADREMVRQ